jgi:hypothetical protein
MALILDNRLGRIERRLDVLICMAGANLTLMLIALGLLWQLGRSLPE